MVMIEMTHKNQRHLMEVQIVKCECGDSSSTAVDKARRLFFVMKVYSSALNF